ncbi:MAG: hypothetical protein N3F66_02330 [Spirochaetes bacterium]|nr:hypothetical protein [Spirochaetota bacterium]
MKKIMIICVAVLFVAVISGCKSDTGNYFSDTIKGRVTDAALDSLTTKSTDTKSTQKSKSTGDYVPSDADAHYIQPSDYFIADREFPNQGWIYVYIAKVVTPPSTQTKNEGQFMKVQDGKEIWTKYHWKSRIATSSDIKIGAIVIIFDGNYQNNIAMPPKNKDEARAENWFMAKITDTTDLYKGYVTVSGGYKVSVDNLRMPLK